MRAEHKTTISVDVVVCLLPSPVTRERTGGGESEAEGTGRRIRYAFESAPPLPSW